MGWIYLPVQVSDRLPSNIRSQITEPAAMSKMTRTARRFLSLASRTDCLTMLLSGTMSEHSMVQSGVERWILSLEDSPANLFLWLDNGKGKPTSEIYGRTQLESLARYDPATHSLKTPQGCLALDTLKPSSVTLPKSGMILNGMLLVRPTWVPTTEGNDSGYWPTPQNSEDGRKIQNDWVWQGTHFKDKNGKKIQTHLKHSVQMWPTPRETEIDRSKTAQGTHGFNIIAPDGREWGANLATAVKMWPTPRQSRTGGADSHGEMPEEFRGGKLNPQWVEWLMGWPSGWTDLKCSEMDGCLRSWFESLKLE